MKKQVSKNNDSMVKNKKINRGIINLMKNLIRYFRICKRNRLPRAWNLYNFFGIGSDSV